MSKFEQLLEGGEVTVKTVGKPKNGGVINKMIVGLTAAFAIGGAGLYVHNHSAQPEAPNTPTAQEQTTSIKDQGVLAALKDKITPVAHKAETKFPIYEASPLVNSTNKEVLNQAGNFELPSGLADNQVARKVSQIQFSSENYYLALTSEAEGYRSTVYNDVGLYATGNGYNLSVQSKHYNENLLKAISKDKNLVGQLSSLAGKHFDPATAGAYKGLGIVPQRSMQISQLMGEKFEEGVINNIAKHMAKNPEAIQLHNQTHKPYQQLAQEMEVSLAPNERAAMLYHTYKVGEGGSFKYGELHKALIHYGLSKNRTPEMAKEVADKFTYKYTMNGQTFSDERASILIGTMFASKDGFGYVIGQNVAPRNFSDLTSAIKRANLGGSAAPGELKIPDPVGDEKAKLEADGKPFDMELSTQDLDGTNKLDVQSNIKNMRAKATHAPKVGLGGHPPI
ncbi:MULTISPECIES: hypothetical protein [Ralstonia]|nr:MULTISPECIES: hypothetical protein [Ralstonia]EGY62988.1 hypothetical protein HMPREF0989_03483 [Ralstonia sp. 5_2_56FAA]